MYKIIISAGIGCIAGMIFTACCYERRTNQTNVSKDTARKKLRYFCPYVDDDFKNGVFTAGPVDISR